MSRNYEGPPDLLDYIKKLEQRVANLERSQRATNTSVDRGSITVNNGAIVSKHPNGTELFRSGKGETVLPFEVDPTQGYVTRITRANGVKVFEQFASDDGAEAKFFMNDREGNEILGDDWLSGRGLSRPFLPLNHYPMSEYNTPPVSTTSATYAGLFQVYGIMQHRGVEFRLRVAADIGTAGNIRLQDTFFSYTIWSDSIAAGFNGEKQGTGNLNGLVGYGSNFNFEIQVQRTAGTGVIRVMPVMIYSRGGV